MDQQDSMSELLAKDFCFHLVVDDEGDTCAFFVPIEFFRANRQMSEEFYPILDELLPEDMDEIGENLFSTAASLEDVEKCLLSLGFVKDAEFSEFIEDIQGEVPEAPTGT